MAARQQDTDLEPVGGWDTAQCGQIGAGRIEQPGDIGAWRHHPTRSPGGRSCAPDAQETVTDGKAQFGAALAERIVALRMQDPGGICGRRKRLFHRASSPHVGYRASRPLISSSIAMSSRLVTTRSAPAARSEAASPSRATPSPVMRPALAASMPAGASSTTKQRAGAIRSSAAASRKMSGFGLPCRRSRPQVLTRKTSSRTSTGVEADRLHHLVGVLRGRCDRHGPAQGRDRLNEAERVREGSDTARTNQLLEQLLLALRIGDGLSPGVRHAQCLEGGTGTAEAGFARHMGLVYRRGEAIGLGKAVERLAPSPLMRGCEQDFVDVENRGRQRMGMVGP